MNLMTAHILRGLQLLFAIIVLGTAAGATDIWSTDRTNFMIFNAVWTILVVLYFQLAPRLMPVAAHKIAFFVVDALTMLFWFAGFIALAVLVSAYDGFFARGRWHGCAAAATAFGAFEWALFLVTTVLNALIAFNKGSTGHKEAANPNPELAV